MRVKNGLTQKERRKIKASFFYPLAGSDYYFCTYFRPYVRPQFSKYCKTKQSSSEIVIATGGTVGLAEWIIDDTHVFFSPTLGNHA